MKILTLNIRRLANAPAPETSGLKCGFSETRGNPVEAVGPLYLAEGVWGSKCQWPGGFSEASKTMSRLCKQNYQLPK